MPGRAALTAPRRTISSFLHQKHYFVVLVFLSTWRMFMLSKVIKYVPRSLSSRLFLSTITIGPCLCVPNFCSDAVNAIRFDSSSACDDFIIVIKDFIDFELGVDLDTSAVLFLSEVCD